jgi:hypothetical protein
MRLIIVLTIFSLVYHEEDACKANGGLVEGLTESLVEEPHLQWRVQQARKHKKHYRLCGSAFALKRGLYARSAVSQSLSSL